MKGRYKNIKLLWKEKILQEQKDYKLPSYRTLSDDELTNKFEELGSQQSIKEFVDERKINNRRHSKTHWIYSIVPDTLEDDFWMEYDKCLAKDARELDTELFRDGTSKQSYKNLFEEFEKGIKKVLGDDIRDWERRIVEVGYKNKNEELISELQEEEEVIDIKNNWIVNLKKEVSLWKTKYYQEKKIVILHTLKLAEDQGKVEKLRESETELKKTKRKLEKVIQEKGEQLAKTKEKNARLRERLDKLASKFLHLKEKKTEVEKELNSNLTHATKKNKSLEKKLAVLTRQRNVARNK